MAEQKQDIEVKKAAAKIIATYKMFEALDTMIDAGGPLDLEEIAKIRELLPRRCSPADDLVKSPVVFKILPLVKDIPDFAVFVSYAALRENKMAVFAECVRLNRPLSDYLWNQWLADAKQYKRDEAVQLLESLHKY
jgi:hypothetical protein